MKNILSISEIRLSMGSYGWKLQMIFRFSLACPSVMRLGLVWDLLFLQLCFLFVQHFLRGFMNR